MADFRQMLEAQTRLEVDRFERWRDLLAVMVAHLMNATGNFADHPVTADTLLGRESEKLITKLKAHKAKKKAKG